MRRLMIVAALVSAACGASPSAPTKVYTASLSITQPIIGPCADVRCQYSAVVTNAGPDCATRVSVAYTVSEPPFGAVLAVGVSAGTMRPGQAAQVAGNDWPLNGSSVRGSVSGDPIACP